MKVHELLSMKSNCCILNQYFSLVYIFWNCMWVKKPPTIRYFWNNSLSLSDLVQKIERVSENKKLYKMMLKQFSLCSQSFGPGDVLGASLLEERVKHSYTQDLLSRISSPESSQFGWLATPLGTRHPLLPPTSRMYSRARWKCDSWKGLNLW